MQYWTQSQKWQNDLCLKNDRMINITVIQAYAPIINAEEAEVEQFCEDLQDFLEHQKKKRCPFHPFCHKRLECKSRKSRDTWNNRQVWPWSTRWSRAKANRVLPREHIGHRKHPLSTTHRDNSTHGHQKMVSTKIRLFIFFAGEDGEALYSQ